MSSIIPEKISVTHDEKSDNSNQLTREMVEAITWVQSRRWRNSEEMDLLTKQDDLVQERIRLIRLMLIVKTIEAKRLNPSEATRRLFFEAEESLDSGLLERAGDRKTVLGDLRIEITSIVERYFEQNALPVDEKLLRLDIKSLQAVLLGGDENTKEQSPEATELPEEESKFAEVQEGEGKGVETQEEEKTRDASARIIQAFWRTKRAESRSNGIAKNARLI